MLRNTIILSLVCAVGLNAGMFGDMASSVGLGGGSSSSVSADEVQNVLKNFQDAEKGLHNSVLVINSALGDKKKLEEFSEEEKKIASMPQNSEKESAVLKLNQDELAYTESLTKSKEVQEKAKKLTAVQKQKVGLSISNLLLVALKDSEGLVRAQNLVKAISTNKSDAIKYAVDLPKINSIVQTVPNQVNSLSNLTSGLTTLANHSGITVDTQTSTDKPLQEIPLD